MENEKIDEIMDELICVMELAEEIVEIIEHIRKQYNAGEDPELDNEFFNDLLTNIVTMKECVERAENLYRETQRAKK